MLQCNKCRYKPSEEDYCQEGSIIDAAMGRCEHFAAANDWLTHVRYGELKNGTL